MKAPSIAYRYQNALYLNITARCPTACEFCIKFSWDYQYRGYNLLLKKEPSVEEIISAVQTPQEYSEIVFCGYGESTYRLKEMEEIASRLRAKGARRFRLNTIGLGNLIQGRNIASDLARFLDAVSVSLNSADSEQWLKIHRPLPEFREQGFESVIEFIGECAKIIPETYVTAIEMPGIDLRGLEKVVKKSGARLRIRPYLEQYES